MQGMIARGAAHLGRGLELRADGGAIGVAENAAALVRPELDAAHPRRLAFEESLELVSLSSSSGSLSNGFFRLHAWGAKG